MIKPKRIAAGARTVGCLSWHITSRALTDAIIDLDPAAARRAFEAMMEMGKIDTPPSKRLGAADARNQPTRAGIKQSVPLSSRGLASTCRR